MNVHWGRAIPETQDGRIGSPVCEVLLANALLSNQTFAYRFNTLHIVPINAESLDWQDRTGVYDVEFDKDSQQAQAWLEPRSVNLFLQVSPRERFQRIFEPYTSTGINIDTTAIIDSPKSYGGSSDNGPYPEHPRRDLLGLHLEREGCYCEQHGNTLIIKRLD